MDQKLTTPINFKARLPLGVIVASGEILTHEDGRMFVVLNPIDQNETSGWLAPLSLWEG